MHLAIFDIDGTVLNSTSVDDDCFIQTFKDLHQIDLQEADWNDFEHVTDSGLTREIFLNSFGRLPSAEEINKTQDHFYHLLYARANEFEEIAGASKFLSNLNSHPNISIAFATGGWRRTALLKLGRLNFEPDHWVLKSADDHFKRTEITQLAIGDLKKKHLTANIRSITYFGDGLWDLAASNELGVGFVGVDCNNTGKLKDSGAHQVIKDFLTVDETLIIKKAST